MAYETTPRLLLGPLFAALLSGCGLYCPSDIETRTVVLSPADYEKWSKGVPPGDPVLNDPTTTTSTGDDTGGGTTSNTDDSTGDTGTTLSEQQICMMICATELADFEGDFKSCTTRMLPPYNFFGIDCILDVPCEGRRHVCVRSHGESADLGPAAAWLARAAHDEAASVHAFEALADELAAHGAPADLLARITTAADDERRHAALVTALAQRHGAEVPAVTITPTPTRDLLALAVENIVEGCVRETWAALSAAHQAKHAHTVELRDLYQSIAADETTHAELAWSIHTWLIGQLNKAEQSLVTAARDAAVRQLHTTLAAHPDEPERQALGIPNRSTALHLLAGLDAALWSQAA
jgi:rubrerythrin